MSITVNFNEVAGLVKDVWADDILESNQAVAPLFKRHPLKPGVELGGVYHQPVLLSTEGGYTTAPGGTEVGTATNPLVRSVAGAQPDAEVTPFQHYARSRLNYEAIMRTSNSLLRMSQFSGGDEGTNKKKAVKAASGHTMRSLGMGVLKNMELLTLFGQMGLGTIESVETTARDVNYRGVAGKERNVSITRETWARGLWSMKVGHGFDIWAADRSARSNTADNTAIGNNEKALFLTGINPATAGTGVDATAVAEKRVITLWHSTATAGSDALVAGRHLYLNGGGPSNEMAGIEKFARNTGTILGINAQQYELWGGNVFSSVGAINLADILERLAVLTDFGVVGSLVTIAIPTRLFSRVASDESALRRYGSDYGNFARANAFRDAEQKAGETPMNGFSGRLLFALQGDNTLEVLGHPYMMEGRALAYVSDEFHRVGAQEMSPVANGASPLVHHLVDAPSAELRLAGSFALYPECPRHMAVFEGITY